MFLIASESFAAGKGGWSMGGNLGVTNANQSDMNTLRSRANTRESGISTSDLGNAWEGNFILSYRPSKGSLAFQLRPSFFYQNSDGSNSAGRKFEYGMQGYTVFPVLRWYLLEDKTIKFFSQFGVGWAFASGTIKEDNATSDGAAELDFSGDDMGYLVGLGSEFCFSRGQHCINFEGSFRILPIPRLIADSVSGAFDSSAPYGSPDSLSQATSGREVELDETDLSATLSGVQVFLGYLYYF
ncbi:MAG: hypothetical protein H6626_13750 [Pseudobdellovibrionaceae bacterium]|nr:hypothetical protein [Bdellovibrionales bacterium]USN47234.1 MAG: hypothetical protein H6626_13750 [Pseudobdellovibrionaceae bacterium]